MKIVACVKYVPDTAIKAKIAPDGKAVDVSDVTFVVNPYDEFAVEEALKIKEKAGGEVVVVGRRQRKGVMPASETAWLWVPIPPILVQDNL